MGLIDSWHNGYPSQSVNSLYGLFNFWSQQFGVDLNSGALGKHLWVIEGTGCIYGCGIATDGYDVAVSHILTLITDVQTARCVIKSLSFTLVRAISIRQGSFWPMGIRDKNDHPKPLRQDLWMGARTLTMSCSSGSAVVSSQEQLMARMYSGCNCRVTIWVSWRADRERYAKNVNPLGNIKTSFLVVFALVLIGSFALAALSYNLLLHTQEAQIKAAPTPTPSSPGTQPNGRERVLPAIHPPCFAFQVLGVVADTQTPFKGIPWVRVSYATCVGTSKGAALKNTIAQFHSQGVRVMLSLCQWATDSRLFDMSIINDAAQGGADAVQCGNEQMKAGQYNRYVPPAIFAKFFDLCGQAMHAVRPGIPIIIGSLDPHVGGIDYQPLLDQVHYLDQMQDAMNTSVHPGGHWSWRSQIVGLIDSWHNGYPNAATNSLYYLYLFWSQQFGVDLNSGALGKHCG